MLGLDTLPVSPLTIPSSAISTFVPRCSERGCSRPAELLGMCDRHWAWWFVGPTDPYYRRKRQRRDVRYAMRRLAKAKRIGRVSVGFWGRVAVRSACVLIVDRRPS